LDQFDFVLPERKKIKLSIYGQSYEIEKPTVTQSQAMQKRLDDCTDAEKLNVMVDLFDTLGLPKSVTEQMEMAHFSKLVEFLTGALDQKKS